VREPLQPQGLGTNNVSVSVVRTFDPPPSINKLDDI
jgi:hypothetical protein